MYKAYEDDPTIPIPKRTAFRHQALKNVFQDSELNASSTVSEEECQQGIEFNNALTGSDDCLSENHASSECSESSCNTIENNASDITISTDSCDESYDSFSEMESEYHDSSSSSEMSSEVDSDTDSCAQIVESNTDSCARPNISKYSETEAQAMCIMSHILRHNLTGVAAADLLKLLHVLAPSYNKYEKLSYEKIIAICGETSFKTVDYCSSCERKFPSDPDEYRCQAENCNTFRYKGSLASQKSTNRQPRNCFIIADIQKQLQYILGKKDVWQSVQSTKDKIKHQNNNFLHDITDGSFYRSLCEEGQFLHDAYALSAIMNTDGIPLYSSSNVKLWPIFLAINEIPPITRFCRDNMIFAAIWQGKNKPPFYEYISSFGEEMHRLYVDGFPLKIEDASETINVRMGIFLATMDLQAKAYVLNMTMHNGKYGCCTCEEEGESVKQGKGTARYYPHRPPNQKPRLRNSTDIKDNLGPNASQANRIKGICGQTGLSSMPWFDVVIGVVPDYMHCVLMGTTKALLYKFFSSTNSGKPYFVGKSLKTISKRLQSIKPPDYIERMPRDIEKHYNNFKATELQAWLLFYAIPCLQGILDEVYLKHLANLSRGLHLLLGDSISSEDLKMAESCLDTFYKQFQVLYGKGSTGLNVHNIGAHLVFYVQLWGPLWSWSCFPFEDLNSVILRSVHGTGDVTKQCLRLREIELKLNKIDLNCIRESQLREHLGKSKTQAKLWSCGKTFGNVFVAGRLTASSDLPEDAKELILESTDVQSIENVKIGLRIKSKGEKFYCQEYKRMKKRICHVVRTENGEIRKVLYFVVDTITQKVFAYTEKLEIHGQSFLCDSIPRHIIRVIEAMDPETHVIPVECIVDKVFLMQIEGRSYIAFIPNKIGHSVFK